MRRRAPLVAALTAFAVWAGVEATNVVFVVLTWDMERDIFGETPQTAVQIGLTAAVYACVGLLLATKRPRNAIGWIFLAIAVNVAASMDGAPANLLGRYALYSMNHDDALPGVAFAASLAQSAWVVMFVCIALLLLLFPNGHLPSRRWRGVVAVLVVAATAALVGGTTAPGAIAAPFGRYDNPFGVAVLGSPDGALFLGGAMLMLIPLFAAVGSLIQRLRRSSGVERQQYALFTLAGLLLLVGIVATQIADAAFGTRASTAVSIVPSTAAAVLPIATAIAILRYRLYEIDRVVSKTIAYLIATVVLAAAYIGLVLTGQALFSSFAGGSNLAIAASTLVVAALFLPLRSRVQRFVDRRFYRRRYDAQRTLEGFGARLREQVDLPSLERDLQAVVSETMQPDGVSLWLHRKAPR